MIKLSANDWSIDNIETIFFDKDGTFVDLHFFWGKMTELRAKEIVERFKLDNEFIEKLCFEFTVFQLSPVHLYDVIQDKL